LEVLVKLLTDLDSPSARFPMTDGGPGTDRQKGAAASPSVTVVLPVRNEVHRVGKVLACIEEQTLTPDEVLFVDGNSEDGTKEFLLEAALSRPWLQVIDNPARVIPSALNLGLERSRCELLARMDAHVDYPRDYLETLVGYLKANPGVAAAGAPYDVSGDSDWARATASVLRRPWGHGGAVHRSARRSQQAAHVSCPVYRRDVAVAAGGWDEAMLVNEDEEMDLRVARHGPIWLVADVKSVWYARSSPRGLLRQMWRYGFYRALTLRRHPSSVNLRILMPGTFVLSIAILLALRPRMGLAALSAYVAGGAVLGAGSALADGAPWVPATAVLPLVHLPYGAGFIVGLLRPRQARNTPLV
jgi:GT2 family glycosyltransferase